MSAGADMGLREEAGKGLLSLRKEISVMTSLAYVFVLLFNILASLLALRT